MAGGSGERPGTPGRTRKTQVGVAGRLPARPEHPAAPTAVRPSPLAATPVAPPSPKLPARVPGQQTPAGRMSSRSNSVSSVRPPLGAGSGAARVPTAGATYSRREAVDTASVARGVPYGGRPAVGARMPRRDQRPDEAPSKLPARGERASVPTLGATARPGVVYSTTDARLPARAERPATAAPRLSTITTGRITQPVAPPVSQKFGDTKVVAEKGQAAAQVVKPGPAKSTYKPFKHGRG